MYNILEKIKADPVIYRQLQCDGELITEFDCPLEKPVQDLWSHENFFVHMLEGRKGWYSVEEEVLVAAGETAFVRKGATILKQYLDQPSCVVLFFVSDDFIRETLRSIGFERSTADRSVPSVIPVNTDQVMQGFFQGMLAYFQGSPTARPELVRLKFHELLLAAVNDPNNGPLLAYFRSLLNDPVQERVRRVMEDNYCFNMELAHLAQLAGRSLAAFKRDVQDVFGMPPGRWVRQRRLERAHTLLGSGTLQVSEVAFQCGFENLSHFSRAFKETYGTTPATVRGALAG
ncbi:MAG TPA: AraC family transcriptional regulator [Flavobacteriales bacterium]|nr:AraC family transcriptional regulator [Flavobacteriales bacterium]